MPTTLTTEAIERSTYAVTFTFTDESGNPVTPSSGLTWTLTDLSGQVVNSRSAVPIASAPSVTIALTGDDLAINATFRDDRRVLTIEGTYTSSLGSGLALRDQALFTISNLAAVT